MADKVIECVPNFSEGRDEKTIEEIVKAIKTAEVEVLKVDPGKSTNRTVITFIGKPEEVIKGAFAGIKKGNELIDMSTHKGAHPRMGACDVCPLIAVRDCTREEMIGYARTLAKKVGEELQFPVYCYEHAAFSEERKSLANIRKGEYEGLKKKLEDPKWKPCFGPTKFVPETGATVIGARDFLIAVNFNLNTTSVRRANAISFDVREAGRVKRKGGINGPIEKDENGNSVRIPGTCPGTRAIGWYVKEYGIAQVSMNICSIEKCALHKAFEEVRKSADKRGLRVTGTEIVGCIPLKVLTDAATYFLKKQERSEGIPLMEKLKIAEKSLGLSEIEKFNFEQQIIEFRLPKKPTPLIKMNLKEFAYETGSESPAPGGGSISAYCGTLAAALTTMVANLSSHKREFAEKWEYYSNYAKKGHELLDKLLLLVDADTDAFDGIMNAFRTPKNEKGRMDKIIAAYKTAIDVPLGVMKTVAEMFPIMEVMAKEGLKNSVSDVGVGILCAHTAIGGAYLNVKINLQFLKEKDAEYFKKVSEEAKKIVDDAEKKYKELLSIVNGVIDTL